MTSSGAEPECRAARPRSVLRLAPAGSASIEVASWRGAKITSLCSAAGIEWLSIPPAGVLSTSPSGLAFTDAEMCGWDECSPTISAGVLADGVELTDHGDVWDVPWENVLEPTGITTTVRGTNWPYLLRRTITVVRNRIRLDYTVRSEDETARPYLWAAHPQFVAPSGSMVTLPETEAMVLTSASPQRTGWRPELVDLPDGACAKWWSPADSVVTTARLERPDGSALEVTASGTPVRWLGVWVDAGVYSRERVIALEPATGWFDSATWAHKHGRVLTLQPDETATWSVELTFQDPSS